MQYLKSDTATTVRIGPFVDSTDGVTAETALVIGQADVRLSKNGAAAAQKADATAATHNESGYYRVPLGVADTDTKGTLDICVSVAGALPVTAKFTVLPAAVYDAIVLGSGNLPVDVVAVDGSAASLGSGNIDANVVEVAAVAVTGVNDFKADLSSLNDPTATAVASAVRSELTTELGRIDAAVSSREAAGAAAAAAAGLNDPTAAAVASAVRTEIGTELGRIDANVSSRAVAGDAMSLTGGERSSVIDGVWGKDVSLYATAGQAGTVLKTAESSIGDISGGTQTVKAIVTAVGNTAVTSPNDFKADLSGIDAKVTTIDTVVDSIAAAIAALDDPSAAQVASAVRTELTTELGRLDAAVSSRAAAGAAMSLTSVERDEVASAILGLADGVEANYSLRQALRLILSAAAAKVSGMNSNSPIFRDVNDTKNRIVAVTDSDGNRQSVTLDAS